MIFEVSQFIFLVFIFLFTLYCFVRDDYILFRKNISIERIFNIAFLLFGAFLVSARFFYVVFNFSPKFLNPLVFLVFSLTSSYSFFFFSTSSGRENTGALEKLCCFTPFPFFCFFFSPL